MKWQVTKLKAQRGCKSPLRAKHTRFLKIFTMSLMIFFFEFTFGQSPDVIARKEFSPISLEAEIAWENPAEVALMYWNVPYGKLEEFINSGNFAENIDGILSYESDEDC